MMPSIAELLGWGSQELTFSSTPALDSGVLLAHVLKVNRSHLLAYPEQLLTEEEVAVFTGFIQRRKIGEPVAYLIEQQEFWSLNLKVTPDVLIPRPETELLVESVLNKMKVKEAQIADLGAGSGAISLALASERPHWQIHATEKSTAALKIAEWNKNLCAAHNVTLHRGDWLEPLSAGCFDAIISNPPYIAENDPHVNVSAQRFEPKEALFSAEAGLKDLRDIIYSARNYLKPRGFVFLEHGFQQAQQVTLFFTQAGYTGIENHQDLAGLDRVTIASWPGYEIH